MLFFRGVDNYLLNSLIFCYFMELVFSLFMDFIFFKLDIYDVDGIFRN